MAIQIDTGEVRPAARGTCEQPLVFAEKPTNPRFIDLTGHKYGRYTVLGFAGKRKSQSYWHCRCDCGNLREVSTGNLRARDDQSCGCLLLEKVRGPREDLTGRRFGMLTVTRYFNSKKWECVCDCGKITTPLGSNLLRGLSRSCGCQIAARAKGRATHGQTGTLEYRIYTTAKERCSNPNHKNWNNYGGRGIEFNFSGFEEFMAELGPRPSQAYTTERLNNHKNYEPGNVAWRTRKVQARNRRNNKHITAFGQTKLQTDWADDMGVPDSFIAKRLLYYGWCAECAVSIKPKAGTCPHR